MTVAAAVSGFIAVALGSFGAHGLRNIIAPDMLEIYKTGILYHLIHSAVLLVLALSGKSFFRTAFYFLLGGIILFSFSLYLYAVTGIIWLAMITPVGGVSFLAGWIMIVAAAFRDGEIKD